MPDQNQIQQSILNLALQEPLLIDQPHQIYTRITELVVDRFSLDRASIWMLDLNRTRLTCLDVFDRKQKDHFRDIEIPYSRVSNYIQTLTNEKTKYVVHGPDDRPLELFDNDEHGFEIAGSRADMAVFIAGEIVGFVRCERLQPNVDWSDPEKNQLWEIALPCAWLLSNQRRIEIRKIV